MNSKKMFLMKSCLKEGDTLLDAGCGRERFSISVSKIVGDKGKIYAIDIFEKFTTALEKEIRAVPCFNGNSVKNFFSTCRRYYQKNSSRKRKN